eukprot:TRINITY_DN22670_c0_g1_i5.p1 TRINITY_DN22670_c0_g1~~TRINITY_DN22670_c0_g1_i5.p1  ORF type:complete len:841 (-),score=173.43 TRINITY_DN22670_c0_g1_i5:134-2656(-)
MAPLLREISLRDSARAAILDEFRRQGQALGKLGSPSSAGYLSPDGRPVATPAAIREDIDLSSTAADSCEEPQRATDERLLAMLSEMAKDVAGDDQEEEDDATNSSAISGSARRSGDDELELSSCATSRTDLEDVMVSHLSSLAAQPVEQGPSDSTRFSLADSVFAETPPPCPPHKESSLNPLEEECAAWQEEVKVSFEAALELKARLQQKLQQLRERDDRMCDEVNSLTERIGNAKAEMAERFHNGAASHLELRERLRQEGGGPGGATWRLREQLKAGLEQARSQSSAAERQVANLAKTQVDLAERLEICTEAQAELNTELTEQRVNNWREFVNVIATFGNQPLPCEDSTATPSTSSSALPHETMPSLLRLKLSHWEHDEACCSSATAAEDSVGPAEELGRLGKQCWLREQRVEELRRHLSEEEAACEGLGTRLRDLRQKAAESQVQISSRQRLSESQGWQLATVVAACRTPVPRRGAGHIPAMRCGSSRDLRLLAAQDLDPYSCIGEAEALMAILQDGWKRLEGSSTRARQGRIGLAAAKEEVTALRWRLQQVVDSNDPRAIHRVGDLFGSPGRPVQVPEEAAERLTSALHAEIRAEAATHQQAEFAVAAAQLALRSQVMQQQQLLQCLKADCQQLLAHTRERREPASCLERWCGVPEDAYSTRMSPTRPQPQKLTKDAPLQQQMLEPTPLVLPPAAQRVEQPQVGVQGVRGACSLSQQSPNFELQANGGDAATLRHAAHPSGPSVPRVTSLGGIWGSYAARQPPEHQQQASRQQQQQRQLQSQPADAVATPPAQARSNSAHPGATVTRSCAAGLSGSVSRPSSVPIAVTPRYPAPGRR